MNSNALIMIVLIFLVAVLSVGSFLLTKKRRRSGILSTTRRYNIRPTSKKTLSLTEMYPYLIGYAANKLATEGKDRETLYTEAGDLRTDIEKEISEKRLEIENFLSTNQDDFEKRLLDGGFINASGKLAPENLDPAAYELYSFYKT